MMGLNKKTFLLTFFLLYVFSNTVSKSLINDTTSIRLELEIKHFKEQMKELQKEVEKIETKYDNSQLTFIGIIVSFFTIMLAFFSFKEYLEKKKKEDFEKIAHENIQRVNELISSFKSVFDFLENAKELQSDVDSFKKEIDSRKKLVLEQKRELNLRAIELAEEITRENYKTHYYSQKFRHFRNDLNKILDNNPIEEGDLNPNCFQILSLDLIIQNLFDEALEMIGEGKNRAEIYTINNVPELIFPKANKNNEEKKAWHKKLINILLYHEAIIHYNIGKHGQAESLFKEALSYDNKDVKSLIYVAESRYLFVKYTGKYDMFGDLVKTFEDTEQEILKEYYYSGKDSEQIKAKIQSLFYIKFGNVFYPTSNYDKIHSFGNSESIYENVDIAAKYFNEAYKRLPNHYLTKFSLAQAITKKSNSQEAKENATQLFIDVFEAIQFKIGETSETKILVMFYYILIICCIEADFQLNQAERYLTKIFEKGSELPNMPGYRIYSPLTKNDLTFKELVKEIRNYTNVVQNKKFHDLQSKNLHSS